MPPVLATAPPPHDALAKPSTAMELPHTLTGTCSVLLIWLPLATPALNPVVQSSVRADSVVADSAFAHAPPEQDALEKPATAIALPHRSIGTWMVVEAWLPFRTPALYPVVQSPPPLLLACAPPMPLAAAMPLLPWW